MKNYYRLFQWLCVCMLFGSAGIALPAGARLVRQGCAAALAVMTYQDCSRIRRAYTVLADQHGDKLKALLEEQQATLFAQWVKHRLARTGQDKPNRYIVSDENVHDVASMQCYFSDGTPFDVIMFPPELMALTSVAILLEDELDDPTESLNRLAATIDHEVGHLKHNHSFNTYPVCITSNAIALVGVLGRRYVRGAALCTPVAVATFAACRGVLKKLWSHHVEFQADDNISPELIPHATHDFAVVYRTCQDSADQLSTYGENDKVDRGEVLNSLGRWAAITPPFDLLHDHPAPQRRIARLITRATRS